MTHVPHESAPRRRPHVICHMITSIDGRIVTAGWPDLGGGRAEYERTAATYGANAWMCGRITMEPFARRMRPAEEVAQDRSSVGVRDDFKAPHAGASYAVAIDPSGRLAWETSDIDGDHVVAVLTERVSDPYLALLRERGVSYLFAGAVTVDLGFALEKLFDGYGIRTILLEGGGRINGAMLREGLVDEVSLLVAPVADGTIGMPALFDADDGKAGSAVARKLTLVAVERRADDVLWLRYRVAG